MKTIDKTPTSYKASELEQMTIKTLINLGAAAKHHNHRCKISDITSDKFDPFELVTKYSIKLEVAIEKTSKNKKKKLVSKAKSLNHQYSIEKANKFLSFLKNNLLEDQTLFTYKFMISGKEHNIVDARIKYRKLQAECEAARLLYVTEKGDFYKNKVETKQTNS